MVIIALVSIVTDMLVVQCIAKLLTNECSFRLAYVRSIAILPYVIMIKSVYYLGTTLLQCLGLPVGYTNYSVPTVWYVKFS